MSRKFLVALRPAGQPPQIRGPRDLAQGCSPVDFVHFIQHKPPDHIRIDGMVTRWPPNRKRGIPPSSEVVGRRSHHGSYATGIGKSSLITLPPEYYVWSGRNPDEKSLRQDACLENLEWLASRPHGHQKFSDHRLFFYTRYTVHGRGAKHGSVEHIISV